jgi:hypothetical protein
MMSLLKSTEELGGSVEIAGRTIYRQWSARARGNRLKISCCSQRSMKLVTPGQRWRDTSVGEVKVTSRIDGILT